MARSLLLRLAKQLVVLALLFFLSPGVASATADALHLVTAGHTIDADDAPATGYGGQRRHSGAPCAGEHNCSGAFHLCQCGAHPTVTVTAPPAAPQHAGGSEARVRASFHERTASSRDVNEGRFKPPRA